MTNSQEIACHGVLMNIYGIGTLITGQSGIGKSEVALALMDRNHLLIADDMPLFTKRDNEIIGCGAKDFNQFMHIRGLGVINVVKIFGPAALGDSTSLHLVVNLAEKKNTEMSLGSIEKHFEIFDVKIPEVCIPILLSLNLAVVIETVVKNFLLKQSCGYDASSDFQKIQAQQLGNHRT